MSFSCWMRSALVKGLKAAVCSSLSPGEDIVFSGIENGLSKGESFELRRRTVLSNFVWGGGQ